MTASPPFSLSELKPMQPIQGWQDYLRDGKGYLKTAVAAHAKRQGVFTAGILYNLVAMAIEKFVMGALMSRGAMPFNHTMRDLVKAMEETFPGAMADLDERLLQLDAFQDICDLDGFSIAPPGIEKIPAMLHLAGKMQTLAIEITSANDF